MYIDTYIREYGFIAPENIPLTSDVAYIYTHPMLYRFSRPIVALIIFLLSLLLLLWWSRT